MNTSEEAASDARADIGPTSQPRARAVDAPRAKSLSRAMKIELVCFALLAVLPLLPYLGFLLFEGAPRYSLFADLALIEHEIRHVWSGDTLLGLGSRFRWHHPGPAFFYVCAPFQKLWSPSSTGVYVGTWMIAAVAAVAPVVVTRLHATRAHAVAVLAVMLAWFAAFGSLAVNPWNRTVVVLPFMAYFLLMAALARGATTALLPAALLGTIVVHTHVASVSTVGAIGALAVVAFAVVRWRTGGLTRKDWTRIAITAGVVALLFAPIIIEQRRAPPEEGNISKLLYFAKMREEPFRPWPVAFKNWAIATSWLPDRLFEMSMLGEGSLPQVMKWEPVPLGISKTARAIVGAQVLLVLAAAVVAIRRRDTASLVLLAFGAIGSVLAISALRAIVGEEHYSLIFWTIVPGTVAWAGVLSSFAAAASEKVRELGRARPRYVQVLVGIGLLLALASAGLNGVWIGRNPRAPGSSPDMSATLRTMLGSVGDRLAREDAVPVVHMIGAWTWATASVLELEKDGVDVRIADGDTWSYAGAKTAANAPRTVHLYFETADDPLPLAPCLELLAHQGAVKVYSSAADVTACDAPRPD